MSEQDRWRFLFEISQESIFSHWISVIETLFPNQYRLIAGKIPITFWLSNLKIEFWNWFKHCCVMFQFFEIKDGSFSNLVCNLILFIPFSTEHVPHCSPQIISSIPNLSQCCQKVFTPTRPKKSPYRTNSFLSMCFNGRKKNRSSPWHVLKITKNSQK